MNNFFLKVLVCLLMGVSQTLLLAASPKVLPLVHAGSDKDSDICKFWSEFQKAVDRHDIKHVESMLNFPLAIDINGKPTSLPKCSFKSRYDYIFDKKIHDVIHKADCGSIQVASGKWAVGSGRVLIWIDLYYPDGDSTKETVFKVEAVFHDGVNLPPSSQR